MKILFEDQPYSPELLDSFGLSSYAFTGSDGTDSILPYVGYVYSPTIEDSIFILPKVFLFEGSGAIDDETGRHEVALGKYDIADIIDISEENNPLKTEGLDRVIFELSAWIYRAIDNYYHSHPGSRIIHRTFIQGIDSHKGNYSQTLIDIILTLLNFHKEHSNLFTYMTIVNSTGNDKIHWSKTINKVQPIIQNGSPYYIEFLNRNKAVNYDEELVILFYSVLNYLKKKYFFSIKPLFNYDLIKPSKIEAMIDSCRGTRFLHSIRKKYFKEELVQLWKLLYAFFDKSELIKSGKSREEALLASSFNLIFEDMVDRLIGQDIFRNLKGNKDGKEIDHIFKGDSLIDNSQIYYIGDSKYYSYGSLLEEKSLYKQFTYAKNIIQLNINIFNTPKNKRSSDDEKTIEGVRYRDPMTEGYNLTPNFFIRGYIRDEDLRDGHASYSEARLEKHRQDMPKNSHFENRLFDRDTLLLQAYNINFLFVLASYVNNVDNEATKKRIQSKFRADFINMINAKYDFYKVTPSEDLQTFVDTHFEEYLGKMYHSDNEPFIWFAFERGTSDMKTLRTELGPGVNIQRSRLF